MGIKNSLYRLIAGNAKGLCVDCIDMKYATALDGESGLDASASSCLEGVFGPWNVGPQRLRTTVIATMAMGVVVRALALRLQPKMSTTPNIARHHKTSEDTTRKTSEVQQKASQNTVQASVFNGSIAYHIQEHLMSVDD